MARKKTVTDGTSNNKQPTVAEIRQWYEANKNNIEQFAKSNIVVATLRDVARTSTKSIRKFNRETLKDYIENIPGNEKNIRDIARYLYYRSNIFYRIINFYAGMWDLRCRKVVPEYSMTKTRGSNDKKALKSFEETLETLDIMNLQGNMTEILLNVYVQDVCYAFTYYDETGMFFYILDPDDCVIDSRYTTSDYGFAVDMSKWRSAQRQQIIEFLGSPLKEMYEEYTRTGERYIHCPDEYAACFKFRTDTWDTSIPPFITLMIQLAGLEDLIDIQAEADQLSIYKLLYYPMDVRDGANESDAWEVTPDLAYKYMKKLEPQIPDGVGVGMVPGKELKYVDFSKTVDSDTNSVEKASNQILQAAGGGAVLNANKITSTAAFNAWLKSETEFAMSTLLPQINGFTNRFLRYKLSNPAKVEHFEVSIYTKQEVAEKFLESCQYSFANRLAYNTFLGISERDTLAMLHFENEVLKLPDIMKYPLQSSYTQSGTKGEVGQGRDQVDDDELSPSGERSRNE